MSTAGSIVTIGTGPSYEPTSVPLRLTLKLKLVMLIAFLEGKQKYGKNSKNKLENRAMGRVYDFTLLTHYSFTDD